MTLSNSIGRRSNNVFAESGVAAELGAAALLP